MRQKAQTHLAVLLIGVPLRSSLYAVENIPVFVALLATRPHIWSTISRCTAGSSLYAAANRDHTTGSTSAGTKRKDIGIYTCICLTDQAAIDLQSNCRNQTNTIDRGSQHSLPDVSIELCRNAVCDRTS